MNARRLNDRYYEPESSPGTSAERLTVRAAWAVILMLSLGLWGMIWLVVSWPFWL